MRKTYLLSILIIFFCASFSLSADKIGYIDSEKVIEGYKGISILKEQYKKLLNEWEMEAREKKIEINKLKAELDDQELMLSIEAKRKKKQEIEEKEKEYEQFLKGIWGENGKSTTKHEEILKPVIEEISNVLEKIGDDEGYVIIFDISKGNIVYVKTGLDLTERVLFEINKEFTVVAPDIIKETEFYVFLFYEISTEAKSKSLGRQISSLLKAGLNKLSNFESVESGRVSEALMSYGNLKEDELDDNQVRLIARRVNAEIVVFGKIDLSSGIIMLNLRWINFDVGNEIMTESFSIDERRDLGELAQEVMTYLGREIKEK